MCFSLFYLLFPTAKAPQSPPKPRVQVFKSVVDAFDQAYKDPCKLLEAFENHVIDVGMFFRKIKEVTKRIDKQLLTTYSATFSS